MVIPWASIKVTSKPCCSIAFFGENLIKNISAINVAEVARVDISSVSHLTVLRLFKLLDFNCNATMECGGCLHGHRGVHSCQCKSTLVPFHGSVFCFYDTTTKCHASTSHTGMSSPRLFGARISLRLEILQWYHVNLTWPLVLVWNWFAGWLECMVPKVIHNFPTQGIPVKLHIFT